MIPKIRTCDLLTFTTKSLRLFVQRQEFNNFDCRTKPLAYHFLGVATKFDRSRALFFSIQKGLGRERNDLAPTNIINGG